MGKIEFYPLKTNPNKCTSHKARSADNWSFIDDCLNTSASVFSPFSGQFRSNWILHKDIIRLSCFKQFK